MYSFLIHRGNSSALVDALAILPAAGSLRPTLVGSYPARLDSVRSTRRGGRVLSGSPAAAIGEIVKRLADGLVVSGISNWPVAISRRKPVRRPAVDVLYPSLPPCTFHPVRLLLFSFSLSLSLCLSFKSSSYSIASCTRSLLIRIAKLASPLSVSTSLVFTFTVIHATHL